MMTCYWKIFISTIILVAAITTPALAAYGMAGYIQAPVTGGTGYSECKDTCAGHEGISNKNEGNYE
jgi:hypothetical protein